jgi:hypothetical protein
MSAKMQKVEGGQGGRKGHSNMTHWTGTEEIKATSKKARRAQGKAVIRREVSEV